MKIDKTISLEQRIKNIHDTYEFPVISVLNHSPAYQFPGMPEPIAKIEQQDGEPISFWTRDWHLMFARAIVKADTRIGFICIRPDERAKEPVYYHFDESILMVHFPSLMIKRISGAACIEKSDSLNKFLINTLKGSRYLLKIMGIGSQFGRNILHCISNRIPDVPILGYAAGDIPSVYSRFMLADLLYGNGLPDRLRFVKHAMARIAKITKEKALYNALAHLWAPTNSSKNHWKEVVDCPISFAPGGYGYDESLWKPGDKIEARKALNLPFDQPVILSSSVLIPKKKLDDLIKAALIVKKTNGELKLIISGYGEASERQRLEDISKTLELTDNVIFTGYVSEEDLVRYYQAADVFVHLSAVEGGPGSAMQALATNTPLVMTPVGCVGELLHISNLGRLFPVGDIAACAEKIINAIRQERELDTSHIAKSLYSWEVRGATMARDIESVWENQQL